MRSLRVIHDERGFAVPTALLMLLAATAIVTVGVISSVRVQGGTVRDQETKSALSVAEAGVSRALLHYNRIPAGDTNPCSPVTASLPDAEGWCGPVTGALEGGLYSFYVRPSEGALEVVSVGGVGDATRRVYVAGHSSSGQQVFFNATMLSQDGIHLDSNAQVLSNVATNGNIQLDSNARVCGQANVGVGKELTTTGSAEHYSDPNCTVVTDEGEGEIQLPPVNQGDVAEVNDNGRFFDADPISGNKGDACWSGINGNGQTDEDCGSVGSRELFIDNNSSVTLGGQKYSFCKLTMRSNASLYIQAGAVVTIYFDSPEACGYSSGVTQLEMLSNSRITSNLGGAVNVALLFVGSTSDPPLQTKILLNSNTSIDEACEQNFVVYAPLSDITLNSNSTFCGAIAGKSIEMDSNSKVYFDADASNYTLPATEDHFVVDRFIECGTAPASPPDTGC